MTSATRESCWPRRVELNGLPGFLLRVASDEVEALMLDVHGEQIAAIYGVRNPDKLRHLRFADEQSA